MAVLRVVRQERPGDALVQRFGCRQEALDFSPGKLFGRFVNMLLCSASAAARKRSISARESCSEGLFWPLALSIEGVAATRTIILHARPSDKRLAGLT
ncbi:hypothetical protein X749_19465 [Mesorhizobium sp. LNJC391B00]|nr:hypothetical protein X749_19465 [Mesorhizobium sp. LNJC391B00]